MEYNKFIGAVFYLTARKISKKGIPCNVNNHVNLMLQNITGNESYALAA